MDGNVCRQTGSDRHSLWNLLTVELVDPYLQINRMNEIYNRECGLTIGVKRRERE